MQVDNYISGAGLNTNHIENFGDEKMAQYNDIYVRDNFGDTGFTPSTGIPYQSPDVIPCQDGTLDWDTANSDYMGPDLGKPIINGGINNIYVRSKNLNDVVGAGKVNLYYSRASLFLRTDEWTPVISAGKEATLSFVDGSGGTSISPNGIAISNPSFLLTGLPPVQNDHYCLIAVVQTDAHPVTIPSSFPTNADYDKWVQTNPGVGYRNISYSPNTQTQMSRSVGFGNMNLKTEYFIIVITGQKFDEGTKINCQCTDKNCPIDNEQPLPKPNPQGNQIISFGVSIPGNFWGDLVVTATSPGGNFPTGASLLISYYQVPDTSVALDMEVARPFAMAGGTGENSDLTAAMLIKLGEYTIRITDNPALFEE